MHYTINNWKISAFEGILFIILGILAILYPVITTFSFAIFVGLLLSAAGLMMLFRAINQDESWMHVLGGFIIGMMGLLLIFHPTIGVFTLTGLLSAYFAFDGISRLIFTIHLPRARRSFWLFLSGLLSLLLAILIWVEWPSVSIWFLGLYVGINFLFSGIVLLSLSFSQEAD